MLTNASADIISETGPLDKSLELKISPESKSLNAELCNLGRTRRQLQPPGGIETGIFDAFRLPFVVPVPTCEVKNYTQSRVFSSPTTSPPRPVTPYKETTHYKLFAMSPPTTKPRTHKMTYSTVFDFDTLPVKRLPQVQKQNPITGEACPSSDPAKRRMQTKRNPITFEGIVELSQPKWKSKRPSGGKSSIDLEHHE